MLVCLSFAVITTKVMDDCKTLGRDRSRDSQLDFWGDLCMRLYSCKNMQAMSVVAIIACYTLGLF